MNKLISSLSLLVIMCASLGAMDIPSPNGQRVATVCNTAVTIWDTQSTPPALVRTIDHKGAVLNAVWSPDSQHVYTYSADGLARQWNVRYGGHPIRSLIFEEADSRAVWNPTCESVAHIYRDPSTSRHVIRQVSIGCLYTPRCIAQGVDAQPESLTWNKTGTQLRVRTTAGKIRTWRLGKLNEVLRRNPERAARAAKGA